MPTLVDPKDLFRDLTLNEQMNLETFCTARDMSAFDVALTIQHVWKENDGRIVLCYQGREYDLTNGLWNE